MARRPRRCAGRLGAPFLVAIISRYMHACSAALPTTTTPAPPLQLAAAARAAQPTHPSVTLCSALPGAAVALTHLESRAAQQQGSAPQWQSVAVKLLHGCAALAATCPNESAPAVAALWQAAGPVLERSKRAIQAATAGLAEGGPLASRVLAGINSHSKLLIALLQRSCPAQPDGSQPAATPVPLQSLAAWLLAAAQALDKLRATCGLTGGCLCLCYHPVLSHDDELRHATVCVLRAGRMLLQSACSCCGMLSGAHWSGLQPCLSIGRTAVCPALAPPLLQTSMRSASAVCLSCCCCSTPCQTASGIRSWCSRGSSTQPCAEQCSTSFCRS